MTRFKCMTYLVLALSLLLCATRVNSLQTHPVTYHAEFRPFGKGVNWKEIFPPDGGPLGVAVELVFSPGTVKAAVAGDIHFHADTQTLKVHGTGGHLSSEGGVVLKGAILMDVRVPLPEAFFEADDSVHIHHKVEIPGLDINKGWNESKPFDSFLLMNSYPETVKLDIGIPDLVRVHLSGVEIIPVFTSAILSGGTLTAAVKLFVDNLSDYLDAGISLNGALRGELTLAGKTITVNGTPVTHEGRLIRAPNFDATQETYPIQSDYAEAFTYTLDFVASSNAYAKVAVLGGIEIWSYDAPLAEKQIAIIPKSTFDLNFGGTATSAAIDVPRASLTPGHRINGLIPDPALASALRTKLGWDDPTQENMRRLTTLLLYQEDIRDLTGLEYAVNLTELYLTNLAISDVSPLSALKNLTKLEIRDTPLSSISLSDMPNLMHLDLLGNVLSEVSLSNMQNLTKVALQGNPLSEVSLSGLPNLMRLDLSGNVLSEVSLSDMQNLESLSFGGSTISKLSLSGLTNLTELSTSTAFSGSTVSKLSVSGLTNLTELFLPSRSLSEVSLSNLPNLRHVRLSGNALSAIVLPDLPNLMYVYLEDNVLSAVDLPPSLPNLEELDLSNNALAKVSLPPHLPNLMALSLSDNALSAIMLPDLPNLMYLSIENNALSEIALPDMPNLKRLFLTDNALSEIVLSDMPNLEKLLLSTNALSAIALSALPNLEKLDLGTNALSEIVLPDMPNLKWLFLDNNAFSEIVLSDMPSLTEVALYGNPLSNVSLSGIPNLEYLLFGGSSKLALSGITHLTELNLGDRALSAISLSDMPNLTKLHLYHNTLSDVSGVSAIKSLAFLDLSDNAISDVAPLRELPNLKTLYLFNNPLDTAARYTHIPAMKAKGVLVSFSERVSPSLLKTAGEGQTGAPGFPLPIPFVVQAVDVEDKPMAGVPIRFAVYQGEGTLSTTYTTTDATGEAHTRLTLGPNPGENKVGVIAEGFERAVRFTATGTQDAVPPVHIAEDVNRDGVVNIQDLVFVSSNLGEVGENAADVNADGVVNIQDLVRVSTALQ